MLGQKWKKSYIVPAMMALFHFSCRYHLRVSRIFFDENFLSTRVLTKARRSRLESCRDNNQGRKSDPFFWIARVTIINPLLGLYYNSGAFLCTEKRLSFGLNFWMTAIIVVAGARNGKIISVFPTLLGYLKMLTHMIFLGNHVLLWNFSFLFPCYDEIAEKFHWT